MMTRVPGAAMPASALECEPRPDGTASAPPGRVAYHRDDVVAGGDGLLQQVPTDAASRRNDGQPHLRLRVVAEFLLAGLMSWSELAAHLAGPLWPPSGHRLPARVTGRGSVVVTASHEISTGRGGPVTGTPWRNEKSGHPARDRSPNQAHRGGPVPLPEGPTAGEPGCRSMQ